MRVTQRRAMCAFNHEGACSIYPVRPAVCRKAHALDTSEERAVCIDLDGLVAPGEVSDVDMRMGAGQELTITKKDRTLAVIDTETLEARDPSVPVPPTDHGTDSFPWLLIAAAAALCLIGAGAIMVSRRRRESGMAAPNA